MHSIKITKIKQTFGKLSIITKSIISKLGEVSFSVVLFHLVHFSVQVPTSLLSKSSCGLIVTKGLYIGFSGLVALMGQ